MLVVHALSSLAPANKHRRDRQKVLYHPAFSENSFLETPALSRFRV